MCKNFKGETLNAPARNSQAPECVVARVCKHEGATTGMSQHSEMQALAHVSIENKTKHQHKTEKVIGHIL